MIALFLRDITLATRSGGGFGLALAFFFILVLFVPFGVGPNRELLSVIAPGILWIGALLSALLSLDRLFQLDAEDGSLEVLMTSPIPTSGVVAAKAAAHWITTGLPLTFCAVPLGYLLNLPTEAYFALVVSLLAGTPALSIIGAFGAAITVGVRRGGLLLSLLVLPLYVPTLIFGAQSVSRAASGLDYIAPLAICFAITLLAWVFVPFGAALALKANLK